MLYRMDLSFNVVVGSVPFFFYKNAPPRNRIRYIDSDTIKSDEVKKFGHNVIHFETAYFPFSLPVVVRSVSAFSSNH